jgi:hypothetical protein
MSGLIVDRGGATAVSERPAAGGVALWPVFEVEESASPQARDANRQQEYATTADVGPDRDHLMAVGLNRPRIATDLLRHNYRQRSTLYRATTKINKTRSLHIKDPRTTMLRWPTVVASWLP